MSLGLPPDWPVCGAQNHDSRRRQTRCRARGDGWGQRCRHHGGLVIPNGPYAVVVSPAGIFLWRVRRDALDPILDETARQRVSWRIAALLIGSGAVTLGMFFGRKGSSLLRELRAAGIAVEQRGERRSRTRLGLAQYTFRCEVSA